MATENLFKLCKSSKWINLKENGIKETESKYSFLSKRCHHSQVYCSTTARI